jgi:hypothetical protein
MDAQAAARQKEGRKAQALKEKKKKARKEEEERTATEEEEEESNEEASGSDDDTPISKGHVPSDESIEKAAAWLEEHEEVNKFDYADSKVHNSTVLCSIMYFLGRGQFRPREEACTMLRKHDGCVCSPVSIIHTRTHNYRDAGGARP